MNKKRILREKGSSDDIWCDQTRLTLTADQAKKIAASLNEFILKVGKVQLDVAAPPDTMGPETESGTVN